MSYRHVLGLTVKTITRNLLSRKLESEVFVLDRFIHPGAVCFDIGAAYGRYTLPMSRLVGPSGRVYCFEPGSISFRVLHNAVRFHHLSNVTLIQKALSNCPGRLKLAIPVKGGGRLGFSLAHLAVSRDNHCLFEEIEAVTLDAYCRCMKIQKVDFIKCDVEGAEALVFEGAQEILSRDRPAVLCEIDPEFLARFGATPAQIHGLFSRIGYKSFRLTDGGHFQEVQEMDQAHNYFFLHSKQPKGGEGSGRETTA